MSESLNELRALTRAVKDLTTWDLEDDLPGFEVSPSFYLQSPQRQPQGPAARADQRPRKAPPAPPPRERRLTRPPAKPAQPAAKAAYVAPPEPAGPKVTDEARPSLEAVQAQLGDCRRCKLCTMGRQSIVFGEGNPNADLLFAGEGPGYHEDKQGRPFVGKAGELLDKMILAMGLRREDVYICNVVKCRPPRNRDPEPDEVLACRPFLHAQVRSVNPKVVVTLGRFATQTLLENPGSIGRLRGRFHDYLNAKLMATYHPAYLLRNPVDKRKTWDDLQLVMKELGLEQKR